MATGTLMPYVFPQYLDSNGNPLSGGKLQVYLAGTTTPSPAYQDAGLTTPHANPIVFDAAGRPPAAIFLDALSYKFVLMTAASVVINTVDNVQAVHVTSAALVTPVYEFGGDSVSQITATSYPTGTTIDKTHAGTSVLSLDSTNLPAGTYALEGMLLAGGGATVTAALVNLTDGSPNTAMAGSEIASTSTTGERKISSSITFAAAGSAKDYAIKVKVSTGFGYVWGLKLRRTA
jgi:hypothetical protein